jgi:hypothetical protein
LYPAPSIIKIIQPKRMKMVGNLARMGEKRNVHKLLMLSQRERGR